MNILVFSDSHGDKTRIKDIIDRKRNTTDLVIHLGDYCRDIEEISRDYPTIAFLGVRGNCDFLADDNYPSSRTFSYEGHRLLLTHGHMQGVKADSLDYLCLEAKKQNCDIALFGHTHIGLHKEINGITLFNPGSISHPRDYSCGSYGMLTINETTVKFEIKNYEGN